MSLAGIPTISEFPKTRYHTQDMITRKDIEISYHRIKKDIRKTPVIHSPKLSDLTGANVYLKLEFEQFTRSFKLRGMMNKIRSIDAADFNKTFVAASTGNHAAAFGHASEKFDFQGKLFLPENMAEEKMRGLTQYAVDKVHHGSSCVETEAKAAEYAREVAGVLIHPYNDREIIKGQGTIGIELEEQVPNLDMVIAPIGGGGLISGLASFFADSSVKVVGSQPANAPEMYDSLEANEIVEPSTLNTIADAVAGGIEPGSITFDICRELLSGIKLVDEVSIKKAIALMYKYHEIPIEPAAALPVATVLNQEEYQGKTVVLVLTGNKISQQMLTEINQTYGDSY